MVEKEIKRGPFGLWQGMQLGDIVGGLEEVVPHKYMVLAIPKPHSAFASYVVQIAPNSGLSWVKAIGNEIVSSVYGSELVVAFDRLEAKINAAYGHGRRTDFLMPDSIWNEPKDWMQSVILKERALFTIWDVVSPAMSESSLSSIYLGVNVQDTSGGTLVLEYSFQNAKDADAEIAALEDDAL